MRREKVGYHGDVANFDWLGAESLEQSALRAYERKCGPCFPVKKGKRKGRVLLSREQKPFIGFKMSGSLVKES